MMHGPIHIKFSYVICLYMICVDLLVIAGNEKA